MDYKAKLEELYRNATGNFVTTKTIEKAGIDLDWDALMALHEELENEGTLVYCKVPSKSGKTMQTALLHKDRV